jgi:hypothetical protein
MTSAEFEALWQNVKTQPLVRPAGATPIQVDLSLTGILNQYMTMAANYRDQGRISPEEYSILDAAVSALKAVLAGINDSQLVADAAAQNAAALQQKLGGAIG